jgi:hypothetical protein
VLSSCASVREARLEFRVKIFAAETQQSVSPRAAPLFRRSQRELSLCRSYYLGRRELERERGFPCRRSFARRLGACLCGGGLLTPRSRRGHASPAGTTRRRRRLGPHSHAAGTSGSAPFARTEQPAVPSFYSQGNGLFTNCSCRYRPR